jgi:hypothetical protein
MTDFPRLVVTGPAGQAGLILLLSAAELVIGHSDTAEIRLADRFVSRRHALVTVGRDGEVTIRDLNSTGGTFVNGQRLASPVVLAPGDEVRFADLTATFEPGTEVPPARQDEAAGQAPPTVIIQASHPGAAGPAGPTDGGAGATAGGPADGGHAGGPASGGHAGRPTGGGTGSSAGGSDVADVYAVSGTVRSPALPGIGGLTVLLLDKNVGGDTGLAQAQTAGDGSYAFSVAISAKYLAGRSKASPDLQVQVTGTGGQQLGASVVRYSAPPQLTLDVVIPATGAGLPSEHETLTASLAAAYPGSLADLQERDGRSDVTFLANKTGWDARAVALAALAEQFSGVTAPAPAPAEAGQTLAWPPPTVSLRPEFYYALFRAGLPASPDALFLAGAGAVQEIWKQSIASGVIPQALADELPAATQAYASLAGAHLLGNVAPAGVSTMAEMLAPTLPDQGDQQQFAELYTAHQGDWASFWPAVSQALGPETASKLQLDGQLYYLTGNNQPLVTALHQTHADSPLTAASDLAARGYYDPAQWQPLIGDQVPPGIPGASASEQAANYARLLAAQVKVAFPTAVLASQVASGVIPIAGVAASGTADQARGADLAAGVAGFLTAHQGDFEVGAEPVQAYLARTATADVPAEVTGAIQRLQRVYQLTPDDASMATLLHHNLDSAYAITRYDPAGFARAFDSRLGGQAAAIHARAKQVFASVLSVAVSYLSGRIAPSLGGDVPVLTGHWPPKQPPAYPVVAFPTLEDLFGSLDYCDCQECGSILSPAAYLADLLHYLDQAAPAIGANPQDVLLQRRPDLQYLPLTCENTNVALPYIDIVNETLEYFVAAGLTLDGYEGHDTGSEVTSAELIASPQYVNDAAYAELRDAFFPPPLPFSRPLALLRLHLAALHIALPDAMAALVPGDALTDHSTPVSYGWADICMERLGISRDEYRLFTDSSLGLGDLYGLPPATALAELQAMTLADFSRRLGVSYAELISIIATRFMNPAAWLIPRLERLAVPVSTLQALQANPATQAAFISALPAGLDATWYGAASAGDYAAVAAWVLAVYPQIQSLITITSAGPDDCSGADMALRYSDGTPLTGTDLAKLIRFVRLWRKITPLISDEAHAIERTDDIIGALYPQDDIPADPASPADDAANRALLDAGFATFLPRAGFLFQARDLLGVPPTGLTRLLACWAPIGTAGADSLYRAMFGSPAAQQDPGDQTATVASTVNTGDSLTTTINGVQVSLTVGAGQTAAQVATAMAAAINATTTLEAASGVALNARFLATAADAVITIKAGCTLACAVSAGATEGYAPGAGTPLEQVATVSGAATPGDTLTTVLNGAAISYLVTAGDTLATIAAGIAAAVNGSTIPDPYSGMPLNTLVVASSAGGAVTISTANAGAPFTLTCTLVPANAGTYTTAAPVPAHATATLAGPVAPGDVLVTTVNAVPVSYTAGAADATADALAANIAATISAAVQPDPQTGLPLRSEVQATSAGPVITITAADPAVPFTLACAVATGAESYAPAGPFPAAATATITGTIPAGSTLTTTVNGLPLPYLAMPGDTPASIAVSIAAAINATTTPDPATTLPLNSVVTASAAGGVLILTALSVTTPFTLAVAMSAAGYTAGRRTPPFADDGYGDYLADPSVTLFGHAATVAAGCNLTSAEFTLIGAELGFGPATPLSLANVSAVLRFGWLAHALGLSVAEFLRFRDLTGMDPFAPLDPGAPAEPPVIRFVRLLQSVAAAGLTTAQALYLIWNADLAGTSAPGLDIITGLAATLRTGFAAVQAAFTVRDDPDGSIAEGLMALVYGTAASNYFFGLLNQTVTVSAAYGAPPGRQVPGAVIDASAGRLGYDDLRKQLTFAGALDAATAAAIDAAITGSGADPALTPAVAALQAASAQQTGPFFAAFPELRPLYAAYVASPSSLADRRTALLASFLPVLAARRKQQQALAAITAAAGTDPGFAPALLTDPAVLHADGAGGPASADATALETPGLTAAYYLGNDLTAPPDQIADAVLLSYAQVMTVGGILTAGDVLTTTINGADVPYHVTAADTTAELLAGQIAAAVNAATTPDPVSTLPLNQVVSARADGPVVIISGADPSGANADFTLAGSVSPAGATETFAAGRQLPSGGAIAARLTGYLSAPQDGFYDINIAADAGAAITLALGPSPVTLSQAGGLWTNTSPISLAGGQLTPITLTATSLATTFSVSWRTAGLGWQPVAGQQLYSAALVTRLTDTYTRFLKATSLAGALSLTAAEMAYLAADPSVGAGWLNSLAVQGSPAPATAAQLASALAAVLDFARLKQALSRADDRLRAVLANPAATLADGTRALLSLTGWSAEGVNALLTHFLGSTDPAGLRSVRNFARIYDAYAIVRSSRLAAPALIAAITNAPSASTVGALQAALRAGYAAQDWLTVIGPISDQARIAQRDALVAYVLQRLGDAYQRALVVATVTAPVATGGTQLSCAATAGVSDAMAVQGPGIAPGTAVTGVAANVVTLSRGTAAAIAPGTSVTFIPAGANAFATPDALYEHFLIDVQTQPPVLTSRIRLALSAVQLFIERLLRNLEPAASPTDIDAGQWAWMKRYRVWQANREVFLWPENWLYPELRDGQSPFFKQAMGGLLQGDITDDAAASAYLDYLTNLEQVAKLEPCGMYYQPGTADTDEVSYVVARTAGGHRKYYFRELAAGAWSPWAEVPIDCEDVPLTPVIWNGRLFLFWLKVFKHAQPQTASTAGMKTGAVSDYGIGDMQGFAQASAQAQGANSVGGGAVLYWTEYYNGKWQPTKTSDVNAPASIGTFDATGPNSLDSARGLIRIVPAQFTGANAAAQMLGVSFATPGDALILAITTGSGAAGGFVLHNTHSLPVRMDDITFFISFGFISGNASLAYFLDPARPDRALAPLQLYSGGYGSGTFSINYAGVAGGSAQYIRPVLGYTWMPRFTQPQPGLAWDAPFLYEDRRNLFYVRTTLALVPLWYWSGFGLLGGLAAAPQIPPLVLRRQVMLPTPAEIGALTSSGGDPNAIQRYLTQNATIGAALSSPQAVTYQGRIISPVGSLAAGPVGKEGARA